MLPFNFDFPGTRVPSHHGGSDTLGHVQEQDSVAEDQEGNEEQVLDRGLSRSEALLPLGNGSF